MGTKDEQKEVRVVCQSCGKTHTLPETIAKLYTKASKWFCSQRCYEDERLETKW